ncbi:MAG TPA: hypothetical protein GXX14_11765 [Clostridiaceae bacterium]|nr:hypothetical protein [Clostridiaceae bacterium]
MGLPKRKRNFGKAIKHWIKHKKDGSSVTLEEQNRRTVQSFTLKTYRL